MTGVSGVAAGPPGTYVPGMPGTGRQGGILRTKSVELSIRDTDEPGTTLRKSLTTWDLIGFDIVATTAEETKNPQKSLPRGILGSLAIVTVLFVAVTLVLTGMVKYTDLATKEVNGAEKSSTLATAFELVGVNWAATVIAVGALVGLTTVVMVLMLGQIRVLFAMARDGLLPRGLARTNQHGTPGRATLLVGVVVAVAATFFPAVEPAEMVNIGTLFAFLLVSIGVVILRRTRPDLPRSFRTPLVGLVPILAVLACIWLMLNLTVETWLRFVIWMVIGVVVYFAYSRRNSVLARRRADGAGDGNGKTGSSGGAGAAAEGG